MIDHVTIRVSDRAASERFYDAVLPLLGLAKSVGCGGDGCPEFAEWGQFSIAADGEATTGLHVGFGAASRAEVDRFWQAGVDAGFTSDGEPGERPQYTPDYYGAFLLDPDGNSIEAMHTAGVTPRGAIDHLWIRVADLDATRRFYETIAGYSGFPARGPAGGPGEAGNRWPGPLFPTGPGPLGTPERFHFQAADRAGFAFVAEQPFTRNLHWAFAAGDNQSVDAFHAAALAAGCRDNGPPGERPQYHAGYYAAFVLDPAGANVELVNHNRGLA